MSFVFRVTSRRLAPRRCLCMWDSQDLQLQLFEPLAFHFGAQPREGLSWSLCFQYPKFKRGVWIMVLPIQIAVLGIFRAGSGF